MNPQIFLLLAQDGLINGTIYALLAVAIVLIFAVTRVLFVPQGEFVALGALTLASLQMERVPGTLWLVLAGAALAMTVELADAARRRDAGAALRSMAVYGLLPALLALLTWWAIPLKLPLPFQVLLTLLLVVPVGPILYRIAYRRLADASVLVLLIVSIAAQVVLSGLSLVFFGAEGSRTPAFSDQSYVLGPATVSGQSLWVLGTSAALIATLFGFFRQTFYGKALMATAVNRLGASLMGISTTAAGSMAFTVAALIGALSGVLIGSFTTIFHDTGFLIGLKGFVAAIIGGLASYPVAAVGALLVGLLESYSSFWASAFKEVIVFTLIIPFLLWRSLRSDHREEDEA